MPAPGAEDFRGFEWYYLWKATHAERRVFAGAMPPAALSPDGRMLATSDDADRPSLQVWDVGSGRRLFALAGHTDQVHAIEFSPDGTMLVSASEDATTRLWRLDTQAEIAMFRGHGGPVMSVTFDPAGSRIATSGMDATTRLWDLQGAELASLEGHAQPVTAVAFSRDGLLLATGSADGSVKLWDAATGKETAHLSDRRPGHITAVAFSPDGQLLATTGVAWGGIAVWDLRTRQLLPAINHTSPQFTAAFSPGGELLATGGHDRVVLVWNVRQQRLVNYIRGHGDAVDSVRFSADGRTLVSASREGTARLWDVDVQQAPRAYRPNAPRAVVFAPDGTRFAVGTDTGVALWDVALFREVAAFPLPTTPVAVAYSPDGRRVAALDQTVDGACPERGRWDERRETSGAACAGRNDSTRCDRVLIRWAPSDRGGWRSQRQALERRWLAGNRYSGRRRCCRRCGIFARRAIAGDGRSRSNAEGARSHAAATASAAERS